MRHKPERHGLGSEDGGSSKGLVRSRESGTNVIVGSRAAQRVFCSFPGASPLVLFSPSTLRPQPLPPFVPHHGGPRTASRFGCPFRHVGTGPLPSKRFGKMFGSLGDSMHSRYSEGSKRRVRGGLWWKRWQELACNNKRTHCRWRVSSQSFTSRRMVVKTPPRAPSSLRKRDGGAVCWSRDSDR